MSLWKAIKLLLTLHCEESSQLVSDGLERDLSSVERWAVKLHHVSCKACRSFQRQLNFLQEAARRRRKTAELQTLSEPARERIRQRLQ